MANYSKFVANSSKKNDTFIAMTEATSAKNRGEIQPILNKVDIIFHWYTRDLSHDPDNVRFAAKSILDGIVKAGILKDDSRKYINSFCDRYYIDSKNPRVEIEFVEG